jgi:hypothetical protein
VGGSHSTRTSTADLPRPADLYYGRNSDLAGDVAADEEQTIASLCQFDILAAYVALSTPGRKRTGPLLAQFARWYAAPTDPIVVRLIEERYARRSTPSPTTA